MNDKMFHDRVITCPIFYIHFSSNDRVTKCPKYCVHFSSNNRVINCPLPFVLSACADCAYCRHTSTTTKLQHLLNYSSHKLYACTFFFLYTTSSKVKCLIMPVKHV